MRFSTKVGTCPWSWKNRVFHRVVGESDPGLVLFQKVGNAVFFRPVGKCSKVGCEICQKVGSNRVFFYLNAVLCSEISSKSGTKKMDQKRPKLHSFLCFCPLLRGSWRTKNRGQKMKNAVLVLSKRSEMRFFHDQWDFAQKWDVKIDQKWD